jgi:nucleoside-diphosphate-sugar epimerase
MSQRVLLTGANGFVAQHILAKFLEAGHSVRAVVRSQAKVDQLAKSFKKWNGSDKLDFGVVPDITTTGAFDSVLVSSPPFTTVIHTASPFNYRVVDTKDGYLGPAIDGTTEILQGITRTAPSVRRVVVTSSMAAVVDFTQPTRTQPKRVYTEEDWNPVKRESADVPDAPLNLIYQASKTYAEKSAWDFVKGKSGPKPGFDLVTINPPLIYGPVYDSTAFPSPKELNQSNFNIYNNLLNATLTSASPVPAVGMHIYVDVRDVATAHLLAVEKPEAGGKRFVVCAGELTYHAISTIMRQKLPQWADRIPTPNPDLIPYGEGAYEADSSRAKSLLGLEFHKAEDTVGDLAVQFVEIEERAGASA